MGVVERDALILRHAGHHRPHAPVAQRKRLQKVRRRAAGAEDMGRWQGSLRVTYHVRIHGLISNQHI
jgi:hypothetical protein